MTTQEIKKAGYRLFDRMVTAYHNAEKGCQDDQEFVNCNMSRLYKMVDWFKANGLMNDLNVYCHRESLKAGEMDVWANDLYDMMTA